MATKDQIDQDALAAEWGLALESDTGAAPTGADAATGAPTDDAAAQWAAMADDPDLLIDGDLHMVDVIAVPDRLEHAVGEAQHQDVLHRLLAEIMIDPVDLLLVDEF